MNRKMRILLINPWIYDFAAYDLWLKPLGLLYISSILKNAGAEISFIDCMDRFDTELVKYTAKTPKVNQYSCGQYYHEIVKKPEILKSVPRKYGRYGFPKELFLQKLERIGLPDVILVSSGMTYWYPGVFEVIRQLKSKLKNVPVILGGGYASLCTEHAISCSGADYVFPGNNIQQLVKLIEKTGNKKLSDNNLPADFSEYPMPDYGFYSINKYIALRTSSGCLLNCSYCASRYLNPKFVQKPVVKIIEEINYFKTQYNIEHIAFYDDALLVNSETHISEILKSVIDNKLNIKFHTPNGLQARLIESKLAKLMFDSGFVVPRLSLETVDENRQKSTGGKVTNQELIQAISYLKEAGYKSRDIGIYILIGMPEQSIEEMEQSVAFVYSLGAKVLLVEYSPIPNTEEWKKSGFDSQTDPLLHNNSIYLSLMSNNWVEIQKLKDSVHLQNSGL